MNTFHHAASLLSRRLPQSSRDLSSIPWSSRLLSLLGRLCVVQQGGALLGCMPGAPVLYSKA